MTEYRKHTYVVGLKRAYAQLQNAVKMIPITQGCPDGDYDCVGMFEYWNDATDIEGQSFGGSAYKKAAYLLSKNFKVNKLCITEPLESCITLSSTHPFYNYYGFTLNDGTIITSQTSMNSSIGVDVNGIKGPNQVGRDIFLLDIAQATQNGVQQGTVMPWGSKIQEQYYDRNYAYWKDNGNCSPASTTLGVYFKNAESCAGRVLEEGAMNY